MTVFDFFILSILGASIVAGALRGLVRALITLVALILGLVIAARLYETAGALLGGLGLVESTAAANAGGFLLVVGVVLLAGFVAGALVRGGLRRVRLEWFDRVLGGLFGFLRGMAVCSAIYLALTAFPVRLSAVEEARSAPALAVGAQILTACTSSDMRARFYDGYRRLTA